MSFIWNTSRGLGGARGDDLLRVVAEEHHAGAVGRTGVAVLLRDFVVGVGLRGGGVEHHLEAQPRQVALGHGAGGALEGGRVGGGEGGRQFPQVIG